MRYIPFSKTEQDEMIQSIGAKTIDDLFTDIPESARLKHSLNIPPALSELEISEYFKKLASINDTANMVCFRGAGAYDHYIPSVVKHLALRGEFFTAYTPYQPEASQGTLQMIYEFQSLICELTGMDVANASLYDGSTAVAEAALMACRSTERGKILIAKTVHPQYREVLKTYCTQAEIGYQEIPYKNGIVDLEELSKLVTSDIAGIIIQHPNFFGNLEPVHEIEKLVHQNQSLLVVAANPISLGILAPPGEYNADICIMEGQALGNAISFGGPYLGIIACKQSLVRRMPGRLVGIAKDNKDRRGFVLTLQAREQHIRRAKATSNICTNQSLNALCATIYLALVGKEGIKEVANLNLQKAHYAAEQLTANHGYTLAWPNQHFFNEFILRCPQPVKTTNEKLHHAGILGGYDLESDYPELHGSMLLCVTEKRTKEQIDQLVNILEVN